MKSGFTLDWGARRCALLLLFWLTGMQATTLLPAGDPAYPLKISASHRYLVDQNNTPFLITADTPWSLFKNWTKEEIEVYLENRRQKGFNTVIVNILDTEPYPQGGDVNFRDVRNRYGEGPFTNAGDLATPNEEYFAHVDWAVKKAAEKGIMVILVPAYLGCCGDGWVERLESNGPAKSREYGRFLGRRYKDFANIMWMHGGDRNPTIHIAEVREVALGIKDADPDHLHTAHTAPEFSPLDIYPYESWLDVNATYTYRLVHAQLLRDYNRHPVVPFFLVESHYENEHGSTPQWIRRQAYWAILSGATGQAMGNRPMWFSGEGWQKALDSPAAISIMHLKALFTSRPWFELVPDQAHSVLTAGYGDPNGLDYALAARAGDGSTAIAYLPSSRMVTIDLSRISGSRARAWWCDPRTGKVKAAGEFPTSGFQEFTPPGTEDWVLVIDDLSRYIPTPGGSMSK